MTTPGASAQIVSPDHVYLVETYHNGASEVGKNIFDRHFHGIYASLKVANKRAKELLAELHKRHNNNCEEYGLDEDVEKWTDSDRSDEYDGDGCLTIERTCCEKPGYCVCVTRRALRDQTSSKRGRDSVEVDEDEYSSSDDSYAFSMPPDVEHALARKWDERDSTPLSSSPPTMPYKKPKLSSGSQLFPQAGMFYEVPIYEFVYEETKPANLGCELYQKNNPNRRSTFYLNKCCAIEHFLLKTKIGQSLRSANTKQKLQKLYDDLYAGKYTEVVDFVEVGSGPDKLPWCQLKPKGGGNASKNLDEVLQRECWVKKWDARVKFEYEEGEWELFASIPSLNSKFIDVRDWLGDVDSVRRYF
ncbi:hypothetical protein BJ508DRAFT_305609 [Ascobolus immersus RN42]|uniref:Uncharacterized protein n=1 Tax=Ascobolus immersus RN42 TaxID=1160509 RepID=A0A3N4IEA0_ASCIM|nr:hypothetical protein BJ508DRAFT_305609 [Ascobolus immersus RN42]